MKLQKKRRPSHLSLAQAERQLPKIRSMVIELQLLQQAIDMVDSLEVAFDDDGFYESEIGSLNEFNDYDEMQLDTRLNKEFHRLSYFYYQKLEQLENHGCILKDLEEGRVDFPHRFQGKSAFLCWKLGEDKIRYWHGPDDGYAGRQRIVRDEGA